jgi:hypothetical protein
LRRRKRQLLLPPSPCLLAATRACYRRSRGCEDGGYGALLPSPPSSFPVMAALPMGLPPAVVAPTPVARSSGSASRVARSGAPSWTWLRRRDARAHGQIWQRCGVSGLIPEPGVVVARAPGGVRQRPIASLWPVPRWRPSHSLQLLLSMQVCNNAVLALSELDGGGSCARGWKDGWVVLLLL